jgi:hypothetical protein
MDKLNYFISLGLSIQNEINGSPITFSCIKDINGEWSMPSLEVTENGKTELWDEPTFLLSLKRAIDSCDFDAIENYDNGINVKSFMEENIGPLTWLFDQLTDCGVDFEAFV